MPALFGRIHLKSDDVMQELYYLLSCYLFGRNSRLLDEQSRVLLALLDGDGHSRGDAPRPGLQSPLLDYFGEGSHLRTDIII